MYRMPERLRLTSCTPVVFTPQRCIIIFLTSHFNHNLSNLQRVQRSTLADLVAYYPQVKGIRIGLIAAQTTNEAVIFSEVYKGIG